MALAACGGARPPSDTAPTARERTATSTAQLRFSQCMRANGVPDYPDPNPDGSLSVAGGLGPAGDAAIRACSDEAPRAQPRTPANRRETQAALLRLTQCLRANGADVEDPVTDASGDTSFAGREVPPAASRACRSAYDAAGLLPPSAG